MKVGLKHNKRPSRRGFKGQSMIVITLALPVIAGALALVVDVADLYVNQQLMQTATDAAVLAGGNYLPNYQDQAISTAQNYAIANGIQQSEIQSIQVSSDKKAITMQVARSVPCVFCAVLGLSTANAQSSSDWSNTPANVLAHATAAIEPVRSASGIVPIGVDYRTSLNFGSPVVLKQGQVGAGNWSPLALGASGADTYRNNIEYGYPGLVTAGDSETTQTGNLVGPTNQAFAYRISQGQNEYPSGTFSNHALNDPRLIVVPMVDFSNINGNSQVPVKGFAMLWIVSEDGQGSINCYFVQGSIPNAQADTSASDYGASTAVVIK
jgi:Flp pilus assembly protein TadG